MDMDNRLASFISAKPMIDPASMWPGTPPNFGQQVVPHVFTIAGQVGLAGNAYLNADEAMMHDSSNAERMKADCGITECLEGRQRATALLEWKIQPEEEDLKLDEAINLAKEVTRIVKRTPRFTELMRCSLEAIWAGKSGIATQYSSDEIGRTRRIVCSNWEPRHGDKLVFRFDDGSGRHNPKQVGIKIGTGYLGSGTNTNRDQIEYTQQGMVYWFNEFERKTFIVHKHMLEDGPYERPELAGRIHGVGIRSKIYWTWYAMVECMQRALEFLDRAAFGTELWRFPANNPLAKKKTEEAAKRNIGGGRSIVLIPVYPGDQSDLYGVEHIEPGLQGFDRLLQVIKEFFQQKMKRYILGQVLTTEAESTGLGSGVADAHIKTFAEIIGYDAGNLEETLTFDFVRQVQLFNFPRTRHILLRFNLLTEGDRAQEKMAILKSGWDMGAKIRTADIEAAGGFAHPGDEEEFVCNPKIFGAIQQLQQQAAQAGLQDKRLAKHAAMIQQSLSHSLGVSA